MSDNRDNWAFLDTTVQKSFFWSLALSVLPLLSALLVLLVVTRWAGPTVWGTVSWAMAFATAVLIAGKFGLDLGASRLASEYGVHQPGTLRRLFRTGIGFRAAFTLPFAAAAFVLAEPLAGWFNNTQLAQPIRIAAGVILCASFYEFLEQFIIGLNRHSTVAKVRCVTLFSRVSVTVAVVLTGLGAAEILAGYCAAWFVGITIFAALLYRYLPAVNDPVDGRTLGRRLFALSVPLAISSASVTLYSQMDKLMLGFFHDMDEVGHYAAARGISEVSLFPAFAFVMMLRPALASRFSSGALDECAALIRKSLRVSLIFGVLFGSIFAAMAVPLVTLVISSDFSYAGELMGFFIWIIVLRSLGAMVLPALVAAERAKYYAYLTAISAVINFGLNLLLIPSYQATGAVVATIVSYAILLTLGLRQISKIFGVQPGIRGIGVAFRTVLAGFLAGTLLWIILNLLKIGPADGGILILLWVLLQIGVYFSLLFLFKVIRTADIRSLVASFAKLKG